MEQYELIGGKVYTKKEVSLRELKEMKEHYKAQKVLYKNLEDETVARIAAIKAQTGVDAETVV